MSQREIKFRAFSKLTKKMCPITSLHFDYEKYVIGLVNAVPAISVYNDKGVWLRNCELMQYTGFKDKNGKEIYEGDILRKQLYHSGKKNGEQISLIKWVDKIMFHGYPLPQGEIEVIGNIYENPELFKK